MTFRTFWDLVKTAFRAADRDGIPRLGAALSFYTLFSLAPLLLIAAVVAGIVFGQDTARTELVAAARHAIGDTAASVVERVLPNVSLSSGSILATLFAVFAFFLGSTAAFASFQGALNTVWNVTPPPRRMVWEFARKRLLSFALVLGTGFLGLLGLAASVGMAAAEARLSDGAPGLPHLLRILDMGLSLTLATLLFAMIYKVLPDIQLKWRDVWIGAAITALFFAVGKQLVGFIVGRSVMASAYGAAGSVVVFLFWVYYSAQLVLLGAEFTQAYARYRGWAGMPPPPV